MRTLTLLLLSVLLSPALAHEPFLDTVDFAKIRARYEAVRDKVALLEVASPFYSDLFGIQLLLPFSTSDLERDLIPHGAHIVGRSDHSITLNLPTGVNVEFFPHSRLKLRESVLHVPYARILCPDDQDYTPYRNRFLGALEEAGLTARYLPRNPYFGLEQRATARLRQTRLPERVQVDDDLAAFRKSEDAVLMVGDVSHGDPQFYDAFAEEVEKGGIDWIGLEMLDHEIQPLVDAFLDGRPGSREALLAHTRNHMGNRGFGFPGFIPPERNPFFLLIETARRMHVRVYALDPGVVYDAFRFGEFRLGNATRNLIWARHVPAHGRGMVFGGSFHFDGMPNANFQDFLHERNPAAKLFLLRIGKVEPSFPAPSVKLAQALDDKRFVSFGESGHRIAQIHDYAFQLFRYLVQHHGYRALVIEASWRVTGALERAVAENRELRGDESFFANAFNSEALLRIARYARNHNRLYPEDPIVISGFQPESPVHDMRALRAFARAEAREKLGACKIPSSVPDEISFLGYVRKGPHPFLTPGERARCLGTLDELARAGLPTAELRRSFIGLKSYIGNLQPGVEELATPGATPASVTAIRRRIYERGDADRFAIFHDLLKEELRGKKAMLWMHNWHAAKDSVALSADSLDTPPPGTISFGVRLEREHGPETLVLGTAVDTDDALVGPRGLERKFRAMAKGDVTLFFFPETNLSFLDEPGTLSLLGDKLRLENVVLSRQFDGLIYFPKGKLLP